MSKNELSDDGTMSIDNRDQMLINMASDLRLVKDVVRRLEGRLFGDRGLPGELEKLEAQIRKKADQHDLETMKVNVQRNADQLDQMRIKVATYIGYGVAALAMAQAFMSYVVPFLKKG